jgi:hypothetical protein
VKISSIHVIVFTYYICDALCCILKYSRAIYDVFYDGPIVCIWYSIVHMMFYYSHDIHVMFDLFYDIYVV